MADKPVTKYAMGFFDAQNLYRHAKDAFGHIHPNFDPKKLHAAVCAAHGWTPNLTRFYTGVPEMSRSEMWTGYWNNRVMALKRAGVNVTTRKLRYHDDHVELPDGTFETVTSVQEKGVDVRLALDVVKLARLRNYDVAVIYSQDQDLCEVVEEVREIAKEQNRAIEICCAFPAGGGATSRRGIDRTQWFKMDETFYNACLDPHDYRPAKK
ncbi:NYN domain-containing protein [Rhodophyticola sp.]|jgi:hypothetical protein|uniref:NYN domain-containing protein n=1 Tax=Rhodophyticola sp. TaxID=2680032 RepID=UPI003D2E0745